MGFFTAGNILTLGIVLLVLILYRQMDKNSRSLKILRDYAEKLKKDLSEFAEDKEKGVKDYSISLDVEKDSARELLKHLQFTAEELAEKAAAVDRIDNRIKAYEGSLVELDRMTGRVQENMNRVRDESAFVENAGKRVAEAKSKLEEIEKDIGSLESKFEKENAGLLEQTAEGITASVRSLVSDLGARAETIERTVEDHRLEIAKIEETRAANLARDTEYINKILSKAVEQAGKRADKMEEAALVSLKEQAEDRIFKLKTAEEERVKTYHENAKARVLEVQNQVKSIREEWRAERNEWEARDKQLRDERKKDTQEFGVLFADTRKRMDELSAAVGEAVGAQEALLLKAVEEMKQKALETSGAKLEEYRRAQDAEFRRLETLADDSRNLDAELRRNMQEVVSRMRDDFAQFERESADRQRAEADKFFAAAADFRKELAALAQDLTALKSEAHENVSEKLKIFEDEFFADLAKRSGDIDTRLFEWQDNLEARLAKMDEEAAAARREFERGHTEEMKKNLASLDARLVSELEHLKSETAAFEEGMSGQMKAADESVASFRELLDHGLDEVRQEAELSVRSEIAKHSQNTAETVKQYQREIDGARDSFAAKLGELDDNIEEARRRVAGLAAETDNRIASVRSSVEDAERHIREAVDQTKLIDKAEALKLDMARQIEDLKSDIDRLDQRRAEAVQLENEFVKIKRLEDDVNAKMARFFAEKRRIETMEADFTRLLQISRAVEEKLADVTSSDDTLQAVQLQIRKLEEALGTTEEKLQRIDRKNQVLDNTNDGIDRNFKVLQESEKLSSKIGGELDRYAEDLEYLKTSIGKLSAESGKAMEASERVEALDETLEEIDERIKAMQRARQWIADAETRFEELNKQAQMLARTIAKGGKGKEPSPFDRGEGAPPLQKRENVLALAKQGWKVDEIANTMKISRGEVELILEVSPRD